MENLMATDVHDALFQRVEIFQISKIKYWSCRFSRGSIKDLRLEDISQKKGEPTVTVVKKLVAKVRPF
jgi:hypothetical protein